MSINTYTVRKDIIARLSTIPNVRVFTGSVPDGTSIPMDPTGRIMPHLVVAFAGVTEPHKGTNGITGAAEDSFQQGFSTHAIAGDDDAASQVHSIAMQKLLGYAPEGCGEIRPAFFAGIGEISSLSQPTRYSAVQSYKFLINPV